jgi:hypothetical protein
LATIVYSTNFTDHIPFSTACYFAFSPAAGNTFIAVACGSGAAGHRLHRWQEICHCPPSMVCVCLHHHTSQTPSHQIQITSFAEVL